MTLLILFILILTLFIKSHVNVAQNETEIYDYLLSECAGVESTLLGVSFRSGNSRSK